LCIISSKGICQFDLLSHIVRTYKMVFINQYTDHIDLIDESPKWQHICFFFFVISQLEICEIGFSTNLSKRSFSNFFQKEFGKYCMSIEIDIERFKEYICSYKNGLEDLLFRRLKLIAWLILIKSKLLNYSFETYNHECLYIYSHKANKLLYVSSSLNLF